VSDRRETLAEAINRAVSSGRRDLYTAIPAKVVKWDPSKGRADCKPLVKDVTRDEEGARVATSVPVIPGVPVLFQGAGEARITFPIRDGSGGKAATTGLLIFSHRSLDKWLSGTGGEVDPELDHDHALADAVFIPGLMPFGAPWQSVPADEASIGSDTDGNGRIHFGASEVKLGDGASKQVARKGDKVTAGLQMSAWAQAVETALSTAGSPIAPASAWNNTGGVENGLGSVNQGSAHIKAVD
jgi:hypothetical protein